MGGGGIRRLVLLRHAKSAGPDVADIERPLAGRGRRDAPVMGRWLRQAGYLPDLVLCSTAQRTRQTWDLVAPELATTAEVRYEPRVYEATALALLHLLREAGGDHRAVLLVGHNPGIAELAVGLARASDGPAAEPLERARQNFPTAAVAVLEFAGEWAELAAGEARMADFAAPRDMA